MKIRDVALDDLVLDPDLNLRDHMDQAAVERYMDAWERMPPIIVFDVDGRLLIADGLHRHAAGIRLNKKKIRAEVREGTFEDALDCASAANLAHGLPLTRAERRRAVEVQLKLHNDRSDRRLCEELGIGRELIAKVRRAMVEAGVIPALEGRVGADGKTYPALPKDPNERLPKGKPLAQQDDPRDRGGRESDAPPWDDTKDPLPPAKKKPVGFDAPWDAAPAARADAMTKPVAVATPTIDEMIGLMTRQVMEVVTWSEADGFAESYRTASGNARGLFQTSVIKLAARADKLRKAV